MNAMSMTWNVDEVRRRIAAGGRIAFVAARSPDVWIAAGGPVEHLPSEVSARSADGLRGYEIVVVGDDTAASLVAEALVQQGYASVHLLAGGMEAWRELGLASRAETPDEVYPTEW